MKTPKLTSAPTLTPFKFGPIIIPVSPADQVKRGKVYPGFRFNVTLGQTEHDVRRSTLNELQDEARKRVEAYNNGAYSTVKEVVTLTGDELDRFHRLEALEKELGESLVNFLQDEALRAKKILAPLKVSLTYVAHDYAARHSGCRPITVRAAAARFLADKEKQGISKYQLRRYRRMLGYLSDKYGHKAMTELTPIRVMAFLRGLKRQIKLKARHRKTLKTTTK
jgi:hypothetical protein